MTGYIAIFLNYGSKIGPNSAPPTFSLRRGVGHVPGEHKPFFRAFQTHSFSENQKFSKSIKYKYFYDSKKFRENQTFSKICAYFTTILYYRGGIWAYFTTIYYHSKKKLLYI